MTCMTAWSPDRAPATHGQFRLGRGVPVPPAGHQTPPQPTAGGADTHHNCGPGRPAAPNASRGVPLRSFPDGDPRTIAGRRKDGDARSSTPRVHEGPGGLRPLDAPGAAIDADPAVPGAAHGRRHPRRAPARRAVGPPCDGRSRCSAPVVRSGRLSHQWVTTTDHRHLQRSPIVHARQAGARCYVRRPGHRGSCRPRAWRSATGVDDQLEARRRVPGTAADAAGRDVDTRGSEARGPATAPTPR